MRRSICVKYDSAPLIVTARETTILEKIYGDYLLISQKYIIIAHFRLNNLANDLECYIPPFPQNNVE